MFANPAKLWSAAAMPQLLRLLLIRDYLPHPGGYAAGANMRISRWFYGSAGILPACWPEAGPPAMKAAAWPQHSKAPPGASGLSYINRRNRRHSRMLLAGIQTMKHLKYRISLKPRQSRMS